MDRSANKETAGVPSPSKIRTQEPLAKRAEGSSCALISAVSRARPNSTVHERGAEENRL
jgi:hypothetical protein